MTPKTGLYYFITGLVVLITFKILEGAFCIGYEILKETNSTLIGRLHEKKT
jgi:hypothetical protein